MKLISVNIEVNRHHDTVLPFLKKEKPDVICLQELLDNDFDLYKKELDMDGVWKAINYAHYPFPDSANGKKHGVAIFAKDITDSGSVPYSGKGVLNSYSDYLLDSESKKKNACLIWADVKDKDGKIFKFINTHLPVTPKGEVTSYQVEAVDGLLTALKSFSEFVLCGDTNAPRGRVSFDRIAKIYKDKIPQEYKTSIDQNLHRVKGIQFMVDALFTTPAYKAVNVKLVDGVSDHMAVVADIKLS